MDDALRQRLKMTPDDASDGGTSTARLPSTADTLATGWPGSVPPNSCFDASRGDDTLSRTGLLGTVVRRTVHACLAESLSVKELPRQAEVDPMTPA